MKKINLFVTTLVGILGISLIGCSPKLPTHGTGVQHTVAAHFHAITHHGADLFAAGGHLLVAVVDDNELLVALDVGGDGARAHVGLVAKNGVAHVIIMGHLHIVK